MAGLGQEVTSRSPRCNEEGWPGACKASSLGIRDDREDWDGSAFWRQQTAWLSRRDAILLKGDLPNCWPRGNAASSTIHRQFKKMASCYEFIVVNLTFVAGYQDASIEAELAALFVLCVSIIEYYIVL